MIIRGLFVFLFCTIFYLDSKSQSSKKYIYYFDLNLNLVKKQKAEILGEGFYEKNFFKLNCYINKDKLYFTAHFTDSSLSEFVGLYSEYHLNGKLEIEGSYNHGLKDGLWQRWDQKGLKIDSTIYELDTAVFINTFSYFNNGKLASYTFINNKLNLYNSVVYDEFEKLKREINFIGQVGVVKNYMINGVKIDSLFSRDFDEDKIFNRSEVEASFPGGAKEWANYLLKNLNLNLAIQNGAAVGSYNVIVSFIVKKNGSIENIIAETNNGFGMEAEAIRIIRDGPQWIPAMQNGHKVSAYKHQQIVFVVNN